MGANVTHDRPLPINDLSRGWLAASDEVAAAVTGVLRSGRYVGGSEHDAFEVELARSLGVEHAVGVASGTDALALALLALDLPADAEVLTAANAGGYASVAAAQAGLSVAYVDVDPDTLVVSRDTLAAAIGPRSRVAIVTHLYGNIAELTAIAGLCAERGLALIEDCAQAIGGSREGRLAGSVGALAAFSFYPTKNLGAPGDAGAVVIGDGRLAKRIRTLRQYGWDTKYRIASGGGRNSRLDEIHAAVLRRGLPHVNAWNAARRRIVEQYRFAASAHVRAVTASTPGSTAHLAVLETDDRAGLRTAMARAGIATDVHYPIPDHVQPGLPAPARRNPLPVTERAAARVVTVPCFPDMTDEEIARVCSVIGEHSMR